MLLNNVLYRFLKSLALLSSVILSMFAVLFSPTVTADSVSMMKGKPLHDFKALSEAVLEDNRAVRGLIYQEKCHLRSESGEKEFPLAIRPFYYTDFAYVPKTGVLATWHNAEHPHPQGHDKLPYDIVRMSMYIWGAEEDKGLNVKLMLSNYKFEKVLDRVYFCEFGKGIELFRTP